MVWQSLIHAYSGGVGVFFLAASRYLLILSASVILFGETQREEVGFGPDFGFRPFLSCSGVRHKG